MQNAEQGMKIVEVELKPLLHSPFLVLHSKIFLTVILSVLDFITQPY
jgi:hypothetical protein